MQTIPIALFLMSLVSGIAIAIQFLVRKTIKHETLEEHSGLIEPLLGVVGTLFSVLLGFLVAGAMDRYHDTRGFVDEEANACADVFRLARGLDETDRLRIRKLCREYATAVLDEEWPLMENKKVCEKAFEIHQTLWEACLSVNPENERITNIHQQLLESIAKMSENRRLRVVASQQGLSPHLWTVIFIGSAITVLFTLFFPVKKISFQIFLTLLVTLSLGLNIWLLALYSSPFSGELQIRPDLFKLLVDRIFKTPDTPPRFFNNLGTSTSNKSQ